MTRTRFEVRFNDQELPADAWSERGIDQAEFFISPNPGEELRPLARIVSGGRALAGHAGAEDDCRSEGSAGKTLIFDEVDAGIGGRVADVVGSKLRGLGYDFQVLCITHLPQIAARATDAVPHREARARRADGHDRWNGSTTRGASTRSRG